LLELLATLLRELGVLLGLLAGHAAAGEHHVYATVALEAHAYGAHLVKGAHDAQDLVGITG
jgi:hypothetical protein